MTSAKAPSPSATPPVMNPPYQSAFERCSKAFAGTARPWASALRQASFHSTSCTADATRHAAAAMPRPTGSARLGAGATASGTTAGEAGAGAGAGAGATTTGASGFATCCAVSSASARSNSARTRREAQSGGVAPGSASSAATNSARAFASSPRFKRATPAYTAARPRSIGATAASAAIGSSRASAFSSRVSRINACPRSICASTSGGAAQRVSASQSMNPIRTTALQEWTPAPTVPPRGTLLAFRFAVSTPACARPPTGTRLEIGSANPSPEVPLMRGARVSLLAMLWALSSCGIEPAPEEDPVTALNLELNAQPFLAVADAEVREASPRTNFGGSTVIAADGAPLRLTYLRFAVSGVRGAVRKAVLAVYVTDPSNDGPEAWSTAGGWSERTLTFADRPWATTRLGDSAKVAARGWLSFDVTSAVTGSGEVNLVLKADSNDAVELVSREGDPRFAPRLYVTDSAPAPVDAGAPPEPADAGAPPPPPPPPVDAGTPATSDWVQLFAYDLSRDEGWSYSTGVRTTDQSYNRKEQVDFGTSGMVITAERATQTATIYSADAMARFHPLPDHFAMEADITLDTLGSGMFPAWWFRPISGQGELDAWEYCGAYLGTSKEMKSTIIKTGSSPYNLGSKAFGIPQSLMAGARFEGLHRWRYEKTPGAATLFVDGQKVGEITRAQFDAASSAGSWDSQFEAGQQWYTRLTYQVGDGANAHLAGPIPAAWRQSTMRISRLVAYRPR
ncbi:MAG: DNRLRE domain-containing protein [Archangiaceae bacterium]|nr:DNRLRE domain-containing protein [Archangiaceae bacterium]